MSKFQFKQAKRQAQKARIALVGPSGSGKTYTSLLMARGLGDNIAVIDTENGRASLYAGELADFSVLELDHHAPLTYVEAIHAAEQAGFDVLVIDSLSHAWAGRDGALEKVDKAAARSKSGNSFAAWREVTPQHNKLVDAMVQARCHVIVTMRAKTEYIVEKDKRGRSVPRKIGLAPVQRDGLEYEFDLVADMDLDHRLLVTKTRYMGLGLDRAVIDSPDDELGIRIRQWLDSAPPAPPKPAPSKPAPQKKNGSALKEAIVEAVRKTASLSRARSYDKAAAWLSEAILADANVEKAAGLTDEDKEEYARRITSMVEDGSLWEWVQEMRRLQARCELDAEIEKLAGAAEGEAWDRWQKALQSILRADADLKEDQPLDDVPAAVIGKWTRELGKLRDAKAEDRWGYIEVWGAEVDADIEPFETGDEAGEAGEEGGGETQTKAKAPNGAWESANGNLHKRMAALGIEKDRMHAVIRAAEDLEDDFPWKEIPHDVLASWLSELSELPDAEEAQLQLEAWEHEFGLDTAAGEAAEPAA